MRVYVYVCVCVCLCVYECVCVCLCAFGRGPFVALSFHPCHLSAP
jgi:hypothetical protein